jgi:hypothetical protein
VVLEIKGKRATRYEHMFGKNPEWAGHLRNFCEAGTVKIKTGTTPKLHNKGVKCMFVGYAENHKGGVYRMWNQQTRKVHITHDVIFLKRMLFEMRVDEIAVVPTLAQDDTFKDGENHDEHSNSSSNDDSDG